MSARLDAAISLFRNGDISAGVAAKVAGKPLAEMLALLSSMNIPLYGGSPKEAVDEMAAGDAFCQCGEQYTVNDGVCGKGSPSADNPTTTTAVQ